VAWLVFALWYTVAVGGLGVTSALALRNLRWPDLILWSGLGYIVVVVFLLLTRHTSIRITAGSWWAVFSAGLAISSLVALYLGLQHGSAGKVVTVGAAYPAVTVLLAALFLSEPLTVPHVIGVGLVIAGCVVISAF
jgi:uncharacterized membrane protein